MHLHPTNAVEVVGKVNPDLSIQMFTFIDFGNNIGLLQLIIHQANGKILVR